MKYIQVLIIILSICSIISGQGDDSTVKSITMDTIYQNPFTGPVTYQVNVEFVTNVQTEFYYRVFNVLNGALVRDGGLYNLYEKQATVTDSTSFFFNDTTGLLFSLPYEIRIEPAPGSTFTFINNTTPLLYSSDYFNQQLISPTLITTDYLPLKPTPSGTPAKTTFNQILTIDDANQYQYYYQDFNGTFLVPLLVHRASTFVRVLHTFQLAANVYTTYSYNVKDVAYCNYEVSENLLGPSPQLLNILSKEYIDIPGVTKSIIVLRTNNILGQVVLTNYGDMTVNGYELPTMIVQTGLSKTPIYASYMRLYKNAPIANNEVTINLEGNQGTIPIQFTKPISNPQPVIANLVAIESTLIPLTSAFTTLNSSYITNIAWDITDYQLADRIQLFSADGVAISSSYKIIANQSNWVFSIPLEQALSSYRARLYNKYNKYDQVSHSTTTITTASAATITLSSSAYEDYTISGINNSYQEIPQMTTKVYLKLPSCDLFPKKSLPSQFPFRFTGTLSSYSFKPLIPILQDTPKGAVLAVQTSNAMEVTRTIITGPEQDSVDLLAPLPQVKINFNIQLPNQSSIDQIQIQVQDDIGIDNERCQFQYGPYTFPLTSENRVSPTIEYSQQYVYAFQLNRYFCGAPAVFQCEDIRGNSAVWDLNSTPELATYLYPEIPAKDCQKIRPIHSIRLLSIDYRLDPNLNGVNYNVTFLLTLTSMPPPQSNSGYQVFLFLESQTNDNSSITPMFEMSLNGTFGGSPSGTYVFQSQSTPVSNGILVRRLFNYRILISDESDLLTLNPTEINYINNQLRPDMKFDTTIQLQDPQFKGFSNTITLSNTGNTAYFVFTPPLIDVKSIDISSATKISPYTKVTTVLVGNNTSSTQYVLPLTFYSRVWLSQICDINDNCVNYPMTFKSIEIAGPAVSSSSSDSGITQQLTITPDHIITTSKNRIFTADFEIQSQDWVVSSVHSPILYLVEVDSLNTLKYQLKRNGTQNPNHFYCENCEIPLNWGSRGLLGAYVYNVIPHPLDDFKGYDYPTVLAISQETTGPSIWDISVNILTSSIEIHGNLLSYLLLNSFQPILENDIDMVSLQFNYITATSGFMRIPSNLTISSSAVLHIGQTQLPLSIKTCMNPRCSGHGTCQDQICQCDNGWIGVDCSVNADYKCLNNCSGHGTCVAMMCNCVSGYMGPSCETETQQTSKTIGMQRSTEEYVPTTTFHSFQEATSSSSSSSTTSPTSNSGLTEQSKQTNFTIMLTLIEEYDYKNQLIKSFNLLNKWRLETSNSTTYVYTMPLVPGSLMTVIVYMTDSDPISVSFANQTILIPENSIKYYIKVENYTFSSAINHLTFQWESFSLSPNPCLTKTQKVTYGGLDKNDIHFIVIPANQLQLYGRFSNLIVVDNRTLLSSNLASELDDRVIIKINTPNFKNFIELDPDFSILIDLSAKSSSSSSSDIEYDDNCQPIEIDSESEKNYILPIAIVVPVVAVSIIITAMIVLYKKNLIFKLKVLAIKNTITRKETSKSTRLSSFK
ncbi:hypothetical protein DLAC_09030 [Tieghemostelium lacteum]|uniref:EGF-like domain-containing protein n=1 Tax=Tieghemostelium lacteum TaxID=361077 RepID=A0A151Z8Z2_TIELA|nr:hypothetical protein DLAC_09030 [Tieghemostelium lacteum]|eukprot:KYQ90411.1 hypothetical protein DLAC_09030 [Tieghemostelium lacteum]